MRIVLLLLAVFGLSGASSAQEAEVAPSATDVVAWSFEDGDLSGWQHKDNATLQIVDAGDERGKALELSTDYGEFGFAWATVFPGTMDFSRVWALDFMIRGDGSGAEVRPTLGVLRKGQGSLYYTTPADAIVLDFEGWQRRQLRIINLDIRADSNIIEDLARIGFVQFMVNASGAARTTVAFDDIRAVAPEGEQVAQLDAWREQMARLYAPFAQDGSNVLPNANFEMSVDGANPLFWQPGLWGTTSEPYRSADGGREGSACAAIRCASADERGSYLFRGVPQPGPWIFSGWYRAETPAADEGRGPIARLTTLVDGGGNSQQVYGDPAADGWQRLECSLEIATEVQSLQVHLFNAFAAGTVYWDDVSLVWNAEEAQRREQAARQNAADLAEVRPMIIQATQELAALKERIGEPDAYQTLALAMLDWALQDAELAIEAELGTNAKATVESARDYMTRFDAIIAEARAKPLEAQPPDADANPYVAALNEAGGKQAREPVIYRKGAEGYAQIDNAWTFRTLGSNTSVMAWGLTHPRSAHHSDPLLLRNLLATMQAVLQNHRDGDWNPGRQAIYGADPNIPRFTLGPTFDAYWQLKQHLSWLILPAKEQEWLDELRVCVEHQYENYGLRNFTTGTYGAGNYPNQDVYYLLICELAHRVWGDQKFADHVQLFLDFLEATVYPMGGMIYHGTQNETFGYHNLNISWLARFLEYTGNEQARRIIEKTVDFYPIMVEPSGLVENYTDASWKHSPAWAHSHAADIVASITGDRQNKRAANIAIERTGGADGSVHSVFAVPWWRDMPEEPLPDNYIIFDENVLAPRARFGPFSFAMNGRDFGPRQIGKDTFIGCMHAAFDRTEGEIGALMVATSEFRLQPEGIHWKNARFVSGEEQFSHVIGGDDFASLAVRYRLTRPGFGGSSSFEPWEGTQQWFASKGRLVGLLHITALEEHTNAGIWGRLRFGRADTEIEASPEMADTFKYGPLLARIHAHNYATIETAPSEVFYLDVPEKFRGQELLLKDAGSATADDPEKRTTYPAGTDHWFLCEVLPYDSAFADEVDAIEADGIRGLRFGDAAGTWIVLHNLSGEAKRWSGEVPDGATCTLYVSGEEDRGQGLGPQAGTVTVQLEPDEHVVLRAVAP